MLASCRRDRASGKPPTPHVTSTAAHGANKLQLSWSMHAKERMAERSIIMSDVLYLLKNGFVHEQPEAATREGYFKYQVEGTTPNSNRRPLCVVIIPDPRVGQMKIVTIMWRDER